MVTMLNGRAFLFFILFLGYVFPALAVRNDVLIIVNDNSVDSPQLGAYYAQKRDINPANIIHIKVPNQYFIDWTQFQSLRDQILKFGVCPSVAQAGRPLACSDTNLPIYTSENVGLLTAGTSIRYLVTTRGVPTRMTVDASSLTDPTGSTSVDNYLKFWLAKYFPADVGFSANFREIAFGDGRNMRVVNPVTDGEYMIGRIDGVDLTSAKSLIDRAISAEANGLYGKLFDSTFGYGDASKLFNYATNQYIYGDSSNSWRYAFGLFGESRAECSDYQSPSHYFAFDQSAVGGKSPPYCTAQFNKGPLNEDMPGLSNARQPKPINALVYFGSLNGQTLKGGFATLLNWRKNDSCQLTLCAATTDPAACVATSTDPYKEINTDCVGVAGGFMGYNHQSFPVSLFGIWPTGWGPASVYDNDIPVVDTNRGFDDSVSLWFYQPDEIASAQCYSYTNGILSLSQQNCASDRKIGISQVVGIATSSPTFPATYRLSFYLASDSVPIAGSITTALIFSYPKAVGSACPTGLSGETSDALCSYASYVGVNIPAGTSSWNFIQRDITPPANTGLSYTSVEVRIFGPVSGGAVGFDAASLKDISNNTELLVNGSFSRGHQQTSDGDYAANFLSRLGGTAFWGSLSHHASGGHAFSQTSLGTLAYFFRGLPLGDAVWFGDAVLGSTTAGQNSGILYGDPIYSPIAVRLNNPSSNQWNFLTGTISLTGSALNGRDASLVSTTYSIDYCVGADFYACGTSSNPWLFTGISGTGGRENIPLGNWDTSGIVPGKYTLRLGVTSTNSAKAISQTFYDYLPIIIYTATTDLDGDGLKDIDEINIYKTDPTKVDTDGDGLTDWEEIMIYKTDPNKTDTDGDNLSDRDEIMIYKTDPNKADTDGDGYSDWLEVYFGGNPLDPLKLPFVIKSTPATAAEAEIPYQYKILVTWTNPTFSLYNGPAGMSLDNATGVINWTPGYSQIGSSNFVLLSASSGGYSYTESFWIDVSGGNTGDINEDGIVDFADALLAQEFALGTKIPADRQRVRADVLHDRTIDISDFLIIQRKALGILGGNL